MKCENCGATNKKIIKHHIIPRWATSEPWDAPVNIIYLCQRCHAILENMLSYTLTIRSDKRIKDEIKARIVRTFNSFAPNVTVNWEVPEGYLPNGLPIKMLEKEYEEKWMKRKKMGVEV